MKRRLLNLVTGFFLLLFVLTTAMWVRSYWVADRLFYRHPRLIPIRDAMEADPCLDHEDIMLVSRWGQLALWYNGKFNFDPLGEGRYLDMEGLSHETGIHWLSERAWRADVFSGATPFAAMLERKKVPPTELYFKDLGFYRSHCWPGWWLPGVVPYWFVALLIGPIPVCRFSQILVRHLRDRCRRASGRCVICGYDLRATPDRCPECGTITSSPPDSPSSADPE